MALAARALRRIRSSSRRSRPCSRPQCSRRSVSSSSSSPSPAAPPVVFRRGHERTALGLAAGDKLIGFTVEAVTEVPEFHIRVYRLTHDRTGAQYVRQK